METYAKSLKQSYEVMDIASFAKSEGIKEGERRGERRGEKRGLMEGRKEGRKESLIEVAHRLLQRGMAIDEILFVTNLPREQINELLE